MKVKQVFSAYDFRDNNGLERLIFCPCCGEKCISQQPPLEEVGACGNVCLLGICNAALDNANTFDYWIAAEKLDNRTLSEFETLTIPKTNWLVFESIGAMPDAIQILWKRIFSEFLPTSGYERADGPDLEVYYEGDIESSDYRSEIWIPIVKK